MCTSIFEKGGARVFFVPPTQEPLWASNMRPLRLPDPCPRARLLWSFAKFRGHPSFATPLIGFWSHGARPHRHPAVTFGGPYWHSVCDGLRVFLVLGQYFRIVVFMRLRILATIAIDPLFEITRTFMAINSCTSPGSHIGTSSVPSPTTMGGLCKCIFLFGVESPYTSPHRAPLSPSPLWVHPSSKTLQYRSWWKGTAEHRGAAVSRCSCPAAGPRTAPAIATPRWPYLSSRRRTFMKSQRFRLSGLLHHRSWGVLGGHSRRDSRGDA